MATMAAATTAAATTPQLQVGKAAPCRIAQRPRMPCVMWLHAFCALAKEALMLASLHKLSCVSMRSGCRRGCKQLCRSGKRGSCLRCACCVTGLHMITVQQANCLRAQPLSLLQTCILFKVEDLKRMSVCNFALCVHFVGTNRFDYRFDTTDSSACSCGAGGGGGGSAAAAGGQSSLSHLMLSRCCLPALQGGPYLPWPDAAGLWLNHRAVADQCVLRM